ncbi:MAG: L,D-transpeptidase [Verrucomicrobiota bacterium]
MGSPASYGCVRMKSSDIVDLYKKVSSGTKVTVTPGKLPRSAMKKKVQTFL